MRAAGGRRRRLRGRSVAQTCEDKALTANSLNGGAMRRMSTPDQAKAFVQAKKVS
jgi:hypothetical protein